MRENRDLRKELAVRDCAISKRLQRIERHVVPKLKMQWPLKTKEQFLGLEEMARDTKVRDSLVSDSVAHQSSLKLT